MNKHWVLMFVTSWRLFLKVDKMTGPGRDDHPVQTIQAISSLFLEVTIN